MKVRIYRYDELENMKEIRDEKVSSFYSIFAYFLLLIFTSFLTWSYFGKIDLRIKATGIIETEDDESTVMNLSSGKVRNSILEQGRKVSKGELLYDIENDSLVLEKILLEREIREKSNLYNAMSGKAYESDLQTSSYISRRNAHISALRSLDIEIGEQEKTAWINREIMQAGGVSRMEYEKSMNQLSILKEKRRQLEIEYKVSTDNEKINIQKQINDNEVKIGSIDSRLKNSRVTAPISGYIEMIKNVNNGDTLSSDVVVAKIIPERESYKVNIYVGENDAIKVKAGNEVHYHLNYPDEKRDVMLKGKIVLISRDAVTREDNKRYYLIRGNIASQDIHKLNLKKGMGIESNIIYSRKSILVYLLEILDFKVKSL